MGQIAIMIIYVLLFVGIPLGLVIFLITKIIKYLNAKTEYYKKHSDDRQV